MDKLMRELSTTFCSILEIVQVLREAHTFINHNGKQESIDSVILCIESSMEGTYLNAWLLPVIPIQKYLLYTDSQEPMCANSSRLCSCEEPVYKYPLYLRGDNIYLAALCQGTSLTVEDYSSLLRGEDIIQKCHDGSVEINIYLSIYDRMFNVSKA